MNRKSLLSMFAVILGLIAGAILMALIGNNPIDGYSYLVKGGVMSIERIGNTVATAAPLILTGLSVAFAFRTGLFNIGTPGQMLFGGFCATAIGLTLDLPQIVLVPLMVLVGIISGALLAVIPGVLKAKFNVHEVVSTIMMNWIAYWIVFYAIPAYFKGESIETESRALSEGATLKINALSNIFEGSFINAGVFLAIGAVILVWFILEKTVLGYELKSV